MDLISFVQLVHDEVGDLKTFTKKNEKKNMQTYEEDHDELQASPRGAPVFPEHVCGRPQRCRSASGCEPNLGGREFAMEKIMRKFDQCGNF